jgi:hypothetical protein
MELDELRAKWAEHDRKLETSVRLNRQLLRENYTGRARFALRRFAALSGLGSICLLVVIVFLGAFIHSNLGVPELVWSAVLLDVLAVAALIAVNFQIGLALSIDYDQPVAAIQKRIEKLKRVRIRYVQGIFVLSVLTWFPVFVVFMKTFFGVDVYRTFDTNWIIWNVAIGLAFIPPEIWLLRKFGNRMSDAFAGYNVAWASGFLKKLEQFEVEEPPE